MNDDYEAPLFDPETGEILSEDHQPPPSEALGLDEARAMLADKHGVAVDRNDPILMLVSLHQAFIRDYDRMLARHNGVIRGFLVSTGNVTAEAVEQVLSSLKDKTVKASLDQAFALVSAQAEAMDRLKRTIRRQTLIQGAFTLVAGGAAAVALTTLYLILK